MFPARRLFPPVFHRLPHHAACGPKGPLYLPGRMPWQVSASGKPPTDERAPRSDFCKKQAKPPVSGQVKLAWALLRARSGSAASFQPGPAAASCATPGEGGSGGFLGHWGIALESCRLCWIPSAHLIEDYGLCRSIAFRPGKFGLAHCDLRTALRSRPGFERRLDDGEQRCGGMPAVKPDIISVLLCTVRPIWLCSAARPDGNIAGITAPA